MKTYQSKYRPLTEIEPSGGGVVSFISFSRLAAMLNSTEKAQNDPAVIDKLVIEESGINIYWKNPKTDQ